MDFDFNQFVRDMKQISSHFEELTREFGLPNVRFGFLPAVSARHFPLVNIVEEGETFLVEALAPGVDPSTLKVEVKQQVLSISGEKQKPSCDKDKFHRCERASGKFTRTINLPDEIDTDRISADYAHGLLTVTLPKSEAAKPRQITINVA